MGRRRKIKPKKGKKKLNPVRKRRGSLIFDVSIDRKKRNRKETKAELTGIPMDKIIKAGKGKRLLKITIITEYRRKKDARTYIANFPKLNKENIDKFLNKFTDDLYKGQLDYKLKKYRPDWKKFITGITFDYETV